MADSHKQCSKCKTEKDIELFVKKWRKKKDGSRNLLIQSICLECQKITLIEWKSKNQELIKSTTIKWRDRKREHVRLKVKEYAIKNKEQRKIYQKDYRIKNREKARQVSNNWKLKNEEKYKKSHSEYGKRIYQINN